jgi:hypothetical protein
LVGTLHVPGSLGSMGDGDGSLVSHKTGESSIDSTVRSVEYNYSKPLRQ